MRTDSEVNLLDIMSFVCAYSSNATGRSRPLRISSVGEVDTGRPKSSSNKRPNYNFDMKPPPINLLPSTRNIIGIVLFL